MRPGFILLALAAIAFGGFFFFAGGRARIERFISRHAPNRQRVSAREAVTLVRASRPANGSTTVSERLEVVGDRLETKGIQLT